MPNFDGQYEMRIVYDTLPTGFPLLEHTLTFDVLPSEPPEAGVPFEDIRLVKRDGLLINLDVAIDAFVAGMIGIYPADSTIIRAELWFIPEGTFAGTFISAYSIDEPGTNVTDNQVAQQSTFTFRSIDGGNGRLQFMESSISGNGKTSYPYASASQNAIADLVTDITGFIIARDNSYMFSNIHLSNGQNERLWRKRYRS